MSRRARSGFTLVELLIALAILAAIVVIMFGGLRVGLAAWRRGDERAAMLDHDRSLARLLERGLSGTFPYLSSTGADTGIVFDGRPDRLTFVTLSPPYPPPLDAPFVMVSISREPGGLTLRQVVMPNPVAPDRIDPLVVDPLVTGLRLRYLGEAPGAWQAQWDPAVEDGLPRAVEVVLTVNAGGRPAEQGPLTIPIRAVAP